MWGSASVNLSSCRTKHDSGHCSWCRCWPPINHEMLSCHHHNYGRYCLPQLSNFKTRTLQEDSSLVACDPVSLGKWVLHRQGQAVWVFLDSLAHQNIAHRHGVTCQTAAVQSACLQFVTCCAVELPPSLGPSRARPRVTSKAYAIRWRFLTWRRGGTTG